MQAPTAPQCSFMSHFYLIFYLEPPADAYDARCCAPMKESLRIMAVRDALDAPPQTCWKQRQKIEEEEEEEEDQDPQGNPKRFCAKAFLCPTTENLIKTMQPHQKSG